MLAYHVCECTRSVPAQASAIARSTPRVRSAAFADDSSARSAYDDGQRLVPRRAERVHPRLDVGAGPQRPHQLGDVHARAAVHLGWVLLAQHVDSHALETYRCRPDPTPLASRHGRTPRRAGRDRQDAPGPAEPADRAGRRRGVGEARGRQPDRQLQGPDGAGDDRGRPPRRAAGPRPGRRRVHRRLHRQLARLRLLGARPPAADRHLRRVRPGEAADHRGVRRPAGRDPQPRRASPPT